MTTINSAIKPSLLEYALSSKLRAFSTTRLGGVGCGNYSEFNINPYCGDVPENVEANRQALCKELGISPNQLVLPHQTHTTNCRIIDDHFLKATADEQKSLLENVDAVITSVPHLCIGVSTADCVPVIIYNEERNIIAAIHAGWRGTLGEICKKAVSIICKTYGVKAEELHAVIGPSISLDAFEVGQEVYDAFESSGKFPMNSISRLYPSKEGREKWHIDLWAANFITLEKVGLMLKNIQVAGICTYAHYERFFSARRLGINSGRIFTGIMIK